MRVFDVEYLVFQMVCVCVWVFTSMHVSLPDSNCKSSMLQAVSVWSLCFSTWKFCFLLCLFSLFIYFLSKLFLYCLCKGSWMEKRGLCSHAHMVVMILGWSHFQHYQWQWVCVCLLYYQNYEWKNVCVVHAFVCVCMWVHMCLCVCMCVHICVCVCVFEQTSTSWCSQGQDWTTSSTTSAQERQSRTHSSPQMPPPSWAPAGPLSPSTPHLR